MAMRNDENTASQIIIITHKSTGKTFYFHQPIFYELKKINRKSTVWYTGTICTTTDFLILNVAV